MLSQFPSGPSVATSGMKKSRAARSEKPMVEQIKMQNLVKKVTVQKLMKTPAPNVVTAPIKMVTPIVLAESAILSARE